ncbi:MAG: hypothetical protein LBL39_07440 [Planctomycetaceae bacterium]|nr:hypothetical protein [Planctomycetaceae bacterium]
MSDDSDLVGNEFIIANPIYDIVFKRLMEDTENARYLIKTLLGEDIVDIQVKPQEVVMSKGLQERIAKRHPESQIPFSVLRFDFVATILDRSGRSQKVLIEVQQCKKTHDVMRFRNYLARHYQQSDEVSRTVDGDSVRSSKPLHIVSIYILNFELPFILTPAVKIAREYIDLMSNERLVGVRENFAEQLTHDCIIIQTKRIKGSSETELDALLSIFEQKYFVGGNRSIKTYSPPTDNKSLLHFTRTLIKIASSPKDLEELEAEEALRRMVEGDFNEEAQEMRAKIAVRDKKLAKKEKELIDKEKEIANKEKEIAELRARLSALKK